MFIYIYIYIYIYISVLFISISSVHTNPFSLFICIILCSYLSIYLSISFCSYLCMYLSSWLLYVPLKFINICLSDYLYTSDVYRSLTLSLSLSLSIYIYIYIYISTYLSIYLSTLEVNIFVKIFISFFIFVSMTRLTKGWTAIDKLSVIWKSDLTNKMKRSFFQVAVALILLYRCTTWTLTKWMEKKLDGNYARMLQAILNKSWRQPPTRPQLYSQLPPITKTINVRRTRHAGHCWRTRNELISDVFLWTAS